MDKTTKTILIILGSVLLVCACSASLVFAAGVWSFVNFAHWADTNTTENLPEVARVGSEITDYTVPDGFGSPYRMHIGEIISIGYASQSKNTHILLTQFPEETTFNVEEMLKLISHHVTDSDRSWYNSQATLLEEKPVTIRGQETTLTISEGTSLEGGTYRSAAATFQGRGGPALVMIAGPIEEWNIKIVETFIASIQ